LQQNDPTLIDATAPVEAITKPNISDSSARVTYRAQVFALLTAAVFAALTLLVLAMPQLSLDLAITRAVQSIPGGGFNLLMHLATNLGNAPTSIIWVGFVLVLLHKMGLGWEMRCALGGTVGIVLLGMLMKEIVRRPRPTSDLIQVFENPTDFGFPSGHVLFFTGCVGFLIYLLYVLAPRSWVRPLAIILLGTLIALVGLSRIYLGTHWTSDVLGGYTLGSVWLALEIYVYHRGKLRRTRL
jgi:undecaprenyl-diphosphatase